MSDPDKSLRIGTMIHSAWEGAERRMLDIVDYGFESFQPSFWETTGGQDIADLGKKCLDALGDRDVTISTIGVYGNPLESDETAAETRETLTSIIDNAHHFGAKVISGFTGRIRNAPIPESLPRFKEVWSDLAKRAADKELKIAFENCAMDGNWQSGDWNIAHGPAAWELMFNELDADNVGLEWEPCHQQLQLIDPIPQIREWAGKIFHVHGKDATIRHDVIRSQGILGPEPFAWMRTPGFGDCNWTEVISELRSIGYTGSIDIEGWHDPVYKDELEMTGQVHALNYLKNCRGDTFVPNGAN